MKICTIHVDDEVNCRIGGLHPEDLELLWDKFGVYAENYFHQPAYQLKRWDGKIRFLDKNGKTYTKLLDEIVPYLSSWDYEINFDDKRVPAPVIKDRIDEFVLGNEYILRPYQIDVVNAMIVEGSGFAICATGSGKTLITAVMSLLLHLHGLQTLIIVPSKDLVRQTVDEYKKFLSTYPISIGEYSGEIKDIDHPIVIATWQSLQNVPHYMSYFQAVIVDECVHPDTLIITAGGKKPIKNIKIGDLVLTLNEQTHLQELKLVKKVHRNISPEARFKIKTDDGKELIVTGNHKLLTVDGWKRVDQLRKGDELV